MQSSPGFESCRAAYDDTLANRWSLGKLNHQRRNWIPPIQASGSSAYAADLHAAGETVERSGAQGKHRVRQQTVHRNILLYLSINQSIRVAWLKKLQVHRCSIQFVTFENSNFKLVFFWLQHRQSPSVGDRLNAAADPWNMPSLFP